MLTEIPGFSGYFIDEDANLYSSVCPGKENVIVDGIEYYKHSGSIDDKGYLRYHMGDKCMFAHRLVAITFIPNPNNYPIINHKDKNPLNNNVKNSFLLIITL